MGETGIVAAGRRRPHENLAKELAESVEAEGSEEEPLAAEALLRDAFRERASDVHLDPVFEGIQVRLRVDGALLDAVVIPEEAGRRLLNQLKALARLQPVPAFAPDEGRFSYRLDEQDLDLRLALTPCIRGEKAALRLLDTHDSERRLEDLGFEHADLATVEGWLQELTGVFLVSGPTGAGKTSTLYALLHALKERERHVITIEDPVEYQVDGVTQIQVDRAQGLDFATGLQALLRLDPDYVQVGEVRDGESARSALDVAGSGRAVMATLHSRDAVGIVSVLRNFGLGNDELAANLVVVVAQRLVRRLCEHCRAPGEVAEPERARLRALDRVVPGQVWQPVGCDRCSHVGYNGRIGVFEVWRLDESDYSRILEGADERALREHLSGRGHGFLVDDALAKVEAGLTSLQEVMDLGTLGPAAPRRSDRRVD